MVTETIYSSSRVETDKHYTSVKTTCAYCGVGCGVIATIDTKTQEVSIKGDPDHPANYGRLCSKGSALSETLANNTRLDSPIISGQKVTWNAALNEVANRVKNTIEIHGSDSVMFYVSGQLLTEDYYVVNKFAKGFVGTNNIDSNSRLCMSSAVAGYKRAFGSDTVPNCYDDIEQSELFIICGSNMAWCHPVLFQRLKAAQEKDGKRVVVIDPRATDSCAIAQLHLPIKPGTDTILFNGLFAYLVANNIIDEAYLTRCDNFAETLSASKVYADPQVVADLCDIQLEKLLLFFQWYGETEKTVTFFSMGVNQSSSGTDKVNSIINCHAVTGRIGKEGMGPFSITGQPNAMGGREVGALANLLAAHYDLNNQTHRNQVQNFWKTSKKISATPGVTAPELAEQIEKGNVKVVWIMATNPVVSITQSNRLAKALSICDLVIVSDCSNQSDTLHYADIILPAQGWGEKYGTVTNSERCISRQRRLLEPYAQAKPDWWIVSQVAQKMNYEGFEYDDAYDVFKEHIALSAYKNEEGSLRSFNLSGLASISKEDYEKFSPTQWPITTKNTDSRRFFSQGSVFVDNGNVQLIPIDPRPPKSKISTEYPLVLNTGRIRDQWHTMTRTGLAPRLNQHLPEPFMLIHPQDALIYALDDGDLVKIFNSQSEIILTTKYSSDQRRGEIFCPMHWSDTFTKNARVGQLIDKHIDPISGQPEFKYTPVEIKPAAVNWHALLILREGVDDSSIINHTESIYWVKNKYISTYEYFLAGNNESSLASYYQLACDLFSNDADIITYSDEKNNILRFAILKDSHLQLIMFFDANKNKLPNTNWLHSCFNESIATLANKINVKPAIFNQFLLAGKPADGDFDVGRIVCSCFTVGEKTIQRAISKHDCKTTQDIGKCIKAGTNCGSCIPELELILAAEFSAV